MLNEEVFRDIFRAREFQPKKVSGYRNDEKARPKQKTLDSVYNVVRKNKGVNRVGVIKLSGHSGYCVTNCLNHLFEDGLLTKDEIGKAGGYIIYAYSVKEVV